MQVTFPLDNSITNLYTIPILQQGGGKHGRTKTAQALARNDLSETGQQSTNFQSKQKTDPARDQPCRVHSFLDFQGRSPTRLLVERQKRPVFLTFSPAGATLVSADRAARILPSTGGSPYGRKTTLWRLHPKKAAGGGADPEGAGRAAVCHRVQREQVGAQSVLP